MRMIRLSVWAMVLAAGTAMVSAQTRPYYGTWKMNNGRSDLKGVTATYKDIGGNRVEVSGMGQKEVFVIGRDGKDYSWVGGVTTTWRELTPRSYESVVKRDGVVITTVVSTTSEDGNTVSNVFHNAAADGLPATTTTSNVRRVSGGPGFFGTWVMAEIDAGVHLEAHGSGVLFRWIGLAEGECAFDGKDCALKGAVPPGATMTLRELGPRSFEYQDKTKGAVNYTSRFTLSDDDKTLTEEQTMATGEKWRLVYERRR